ncbi:MAG: archease [Syntrophales bacterium]
MSMINRRFRLFDHTADLGVEFFGPTREELYVCAALAVVALITHADCVSPDQEKHFSVEGADETDLFVNFLREVLYLINGERFLPKTVAINACDAYRLTAILHGEHINTQKHLINKEIKAVTYHKAAVEKTEQGWKGRIIFDV